MVRPWTTRTVVAVVGTGVAVLAWTSLAFVESDVWAHDLWFLVPVLMWSALVWWNKFRFYRGQNKLDRRIVKLLQLHSWVHGLYIVLYLVALGLMVAGYVNTGRYLWRTVLSVQAALNTLHPLWSAAQQGTNLKGNALYRQHSTRALLGAFSTQLSKQKPPSAPWTKDDSPVIRSGKTTVRTSPETPVLSVLQTNIMGPVRFHVPGEYDASTMSSSETSTMSKSATSASYLDSYHKTT